jgi:hypothetical protein
MVLKSNIKKKDIYDNSNETAFFLLLFLSCIALATLGCRKGKLNTRIRSGLNKNIIRYARKMSNS